MLNEDEKKNIVKVETAQLLKKVGFKDKVNYHYSFYHTYFQNNIEKPSLLHGKNDNCYDDNIVSAPTIDRTIDWLYNNFNIFVTINYTINKAGGLTNIFKAFIDEGGYWDILIHIEKRINEDIYNLGINKVLEYLYNNQKPNKTLLKTYYFNGINLKYINYLYDFGVEGRMNLYEDSRSNHQNQIFQYLKNIIDCTDEKGNSIKTINNEKLNHTIFKGYIGGNSYSTIKIENGISVGSIVINIANIIDSIYQLNKYKNFNDFNNFDETFILDKIQFFDDCSFEIKIMTNRNLGTKS